MKLPSFKTIFTFILFACFFFLLGFSYTYHLPRAKAWIRVKVAKETQNFPLQALPTNVNFDLFPPAIELLDVRVRPSQELQQTLDPFTIESLSVSLNAASFLGGNFKIGEIKLSGTSITAIDSTKINPSTKSDTPKKEIPIEKSTVDKIFESLSAFPVAEVELENVFITVVRTNYGDIVRLKNLNLSVENRSSSAYAEIELDQFSYIKEGDPPQYTEFGLKTRLLLEPNRLSIPSFSLLKGDSYLVSTGYVEPTDNFSELKETKVKTRIVADLKEARLWVKSFAPFLEIPILGGELNADFSVTKNPGENMTVEFSGAGKKISVQNINVGAFDTKGIFQNNSIQAKYLRVQRKKTDFSVRDAQLSLDKPMKYTASLDVNSLELRQLLQDLGVGDTPLHLDVQGSIPCSGQLEKPLSLGCQGEIELANFVVYSDKEANKKIVGFNKGTIKGSLKLNSKQINLTGDLKIGESKGKASGYVSFQDGFKFDYSSPELNFKDLSSLGDLKFEGTTSIRGTTQGNAESARFQMDLDAKNIWFEDYGIGDLTTSLSYRSGTLLLSDIVGRFDSSSYQGTFSVNFQTNRLKSNVSIPKFDLSDLQKMFSRKVTLPFDSAGRGKASLDVEGPFAFNQLTYKLTSRVRNGVIANETFDEIRFDVSSKDGHVKSDRVRVKKGEGEATLSGKGFPSGNIDVSIVGRDFLLARSQILNDLNFSMGGTADFTMQLKEHVLSPDTLLKGRIRNFELSGTPLPSPRIELKFFGDRLFVASKFEDNSMSFSSLIPYNSKLPFQLKMDAENWDFSPFLSIFGKDILIQEYRTSLTASVDLKSPSDFIWNSEGFVKLDTLRIQRGVNELYLENPVQITFENSSMSSTPIVLNGDNTLLRIEAKNSKKSNLNVDLSGKIETALVAFLTPFLSDIRGILTLSCEISGSSIDPKLLGSAYWENGFVKVRDFPHAFENIKSDILFSQKRVLINSMNAKLSTGTVEGEGSILIKGFANFPTNINAKVNDVKFLIPEGVETLGSGDVTITGNWFPFLIKGNFDVDRAMVRKEFDGTSNESQVRRSIFLPEIVAKDAFSPIELDIQTKFDQNATVINSLVESDFRGNLRILGTPENPKFLGEVQLVNDGIFKFRETPFEIRTARFQFLSADEVNPTIYLTGTTRVNEYEISLLVQGTSKDYDISFQSTPELAENDIVSLLALGFTASELDGEITSEEQVNKQTYDAAGQILENNPLGKSIRRSTGFEIKLSSDIDDTSDVGSPRAVPKMIIKRQWTPEFSTSVSRTIGETSTSDAQVEYQLNSNVSVIGSWESREVTEDPTNTFREEEEETNILGLDLQYRVNFK